MFEENKVLVANATGRKGIRWIDILLLLTTAFLMFWGLGGRGLWGSEGRWAEITREMFLTGDFFHPTIGGQAYFDKPLLTYWFVAVVSFFSGTLNEWVVRIPSAVAGVVAVWATMLLGRRIWSDRVGSVAGWLLLTSYGVIFWSRVAAADTENLAVITVCILWYWSRRDRLNFKTFVIFYLIAFVGAQTKGLTAVVVPVLVVLPDIVMHNRLKKLLRPCHFLAFGLALMVYLFPFLYASVSQPAGYHDSGLALVFQENMLRYFRPIDHKGPFYVYLYAVPMLMLPWAPLFIAGLIGLLGIWKDLDRKTRWLLMAIGVVLLFFTLSGSRRDYYILPITPLCALLMAVFLVGVSDGRIDKARRVGIDIQKYICIVLISLEIGLPFILLFLPARKSFDFFVSLSVSGIIVGATASVAWLIVRKANFGKYSLTKQMQQLAGLVVVTVIMFGGFFCWQQNIMDNLRTEHSFIEEVKAGTSALPASSIGFYPKNNATLCFYLDRDEPTQIVNTAEDWQRFLAGGQPRVLITRRKYVSTVPQEYTTLVQAKPDIVEKTEVWDSASAKKNKWVAWFFNYKPTKSNAALEEKEKI